MFDQPIHTVGGVCPGVGDLWKVETQNATYWVDYVLGALRRVPHPAADVCDSDVTALRKDGELMPLLWVDQLEVGRSMVTIVQVRSDGIATVRVSSPVVTLEVVPDASPPSR